MGVPVNVKDIVSAGKGLIEERGAIVRVAVFVDPAASDALIEAVRTAFVPASVQGRIHVEVLEAGVEPAVEPSTDVAVVVWGRSVPVDRLVSRFAEMSIPVAVLGDAPDGPSGVATGVYIGDEDSDRVIDRLGSWLVDHAEPKRLPLAANFAFMRRAVALEAVRATAFQNAMVGGLLIIPGADMPVMTANQAKMLLQIAAAYGQPLGADRIKELAAIVAGGFAFRTVARQVVGLVPGLGWAVKAGIGYSGTLAMGRAAVEYFESGGDVSGLAKKAVEARDAVVEKARSRRTHCIEGTVEAPEENRDQA